MKTLEYQLAFLSSEVNEFAVPVIIVAAGSSTRMNGISKQFAKISGVPVIARTLLAFERSKYISKIILVTKSEFIPDMQKFCDEYMITKLTDIVEGGSNRQESVFKGLLCVKDEKKVMIHDGARPLISQDVICRVFEALQAADGVICGVKLKDTIKEIDQNGIVEKTHDRSKMLCVQTPQGADVGKYISILENIDCSRFTDDASILEYAGISVKAVDGDYKNIKITTPEDIALAEFYIEKMGDN